MDPVSIIAGALIAGAAAATLGGGVHLGAKSKPEEDEANG